MSTWITLLTFTYPHEAQITKAKLESEGIEVYLGSAEKLRSAYTF